MNTDDRLPEDELSRVLHDEADQVETDPAALHKIQQRTSRGGHGRPWLYAGVGVAAATAAIITGVALASDSSSPSSGPAPATQGSDPTPANDDSSPDVAYVGETDPGHVVYVGASNPRLYSERAEVPNDNIAAMNAMLSTPPRDPDYVSGWPEGVQVEAFQEGDSTGTLELSGPAGAPVADDPGLGENGGQLAIDALLYNGNFQPGETVGFTYNGDPLPTVLGVQGPVTLSQPADVRAFIQITNLDEGEEVSSPVTVTVFGNTFEGNVNWQLLDDTDAKIDDGYVTTSMGSWTKAVIKLGDLDPGTYTIRCLEYSPENGKPGNVDDKTFTVS
jgi:hypothetical protein